MVLSSLDSNTSLPFSHLDLNQSAMVHEETLPASVNIGVAEDRKNDIVIGSAAGVVYTFSAHHSLLNRHVDDNGAIGKLICLDQPTRTLEDDGAERMLIQLGPQGHKPSCTWVGILDASLEYVKVPVRVSYRDTNRTRATCYSPSKHDQMIFKAATFFGCPVSLDGLDYDETDLRLLTLRKAQAFRVSRAFRVISKQSAHDRESLGRSQSAADDDQGRTGIIHGQDGQVGQESQGGRSNETKSRGNGNRGSSSGHCPDGFGKPGIPENPGNLAFTNVLNPKVGDTKRQQQQHLQQ